jgi:type III secretion protein S
MLNTQVIALTIEALWLVLILSAPPIVVAALAGLLVAIIQAATQIQEQTLQYTIKFFAIVVTLFVSASLLAGSLYSFSTRVFETFPAVVQ